jgi:tetratricopeptide (TPR) repeat protein
LLLAETNLRLNRPNTAWKVAEQAIKLYKHREDAWLLAARSAQQAGEAQKAIECLELYLKMNSRQIIGPMAYILMAQAYLELNQNEQALEQLEVAQARLKAQFATPGPAFVALRARILRSLGKDDEAHSYYQQALQLDPQNPAMHNELGEALLAREKTEEALKAYQKALQLDPDNSEYYYNAGVAALRSISLPGQFSRRAEKMQQHAIDYLSRASQLNPVVAHYWYELACAYGTVPNYRLMQQALQKAMTQSVAFAETEAPQIQYMRLYAATCLKLGDYEGAQETLNQILATLPDDHETLNELGEVAYRQGNYGESFNYFRKAEHRSNDHPRYLANMSRALLKLERLEEAHELVHPVADSDDHYVQHQLGAVLLERGNPADALEKLRIAAEKEPGNAEFRYYLGRAHLQLGQLGEATQEYSEAVAQAPLQHRWHAELGEIHLKERAYLPALESLRLAVQLDPANLDYRYNLSIALAANGELQQAIQVVREVINATHGEVGAEWHYLLGRLVTELGHFEEALKCFERAHDLEPDNPHYKLDLAKTRRLRGEPIEEIKNLLMEAIKDNPNNLRSFEELAYVYEASDDPDAAIRTLEARLNEVLETVSTF